jgi:hypothetical protein
MLTYHIKWPPLPETEDKGIAYHIKNRTKDLIKNKNCYRRKGTHAV